MNNGGNEPKDFEFREINPLLPKECIVKSLGLLVLVSLLSAPLFAAYSSIETPEDRILAKGFASYMDGNNKQALSYFEEVIRLNPRNSAAQKGLEKAKVRLKKMEDADREKSKWLAKAKYKEGRDFLRGGDIVAAIDAFQVAIDADPQHKASISELAAIRKKMEKSTDRRRLNLSNYAYTRGTIAYLDRDWSKAWRVWSERLQVEPNNVVLANATARAESKFKKMMMTEQEDFFRRGARAFYAQGLYKESQVSWTKVLALRPDDMEALEGKVRSEEAILRAEGKGRDNEMHDLLEQGLEYYASQNWRKALSVFEQIVRLDPSFDTAKEYIAKLNRHLEAPDYIPSSVASGGNWRENKPSNQGNESVKIPDNLENFSASKKELVSQLNRDPSNIRIQQELDRVSKMQEEKCEEIYKDGLIAYSQGNRGLAIQEWKKVLVMDPEHKKALAALRKAKAEDEREEITAAAEPQ